MVTVTFLDGTKKDVSSGTTIADCILHHIGEGLFRAAVAAKIDDHVVDLATPITTDCTLTVLTFKDDEGKAIYWHSTAHILAIAVTRLFPQAKLTIGPPIDEGFYYDFAIDTPFTDKDLENIEAEMKKIIKEKIPFVRKTITYEESQALFSDNTYKKEIVEEYKKDGLTIYENGEFYDLCKGPHVLDTGRIKAV
ncbi:MAG: TGS domain-containing protein, partial [Candidatus Woesearchaeota archaeon]